VTTSNVAADELLSEGVRGMREFLLNQGWQHGRRPGELNSRADNGTEIHIRTGYTHASFRLIVFGRLNGEKQGQHYIDFNRGVDPRRILEIQQSLADWDGVVWPPHPDMVPSNTGQGDGWPPADLT
jgi:hypothetical protein